MLSITLGTLVLVVASAVSAQQSASAKVGPTAEHRVTSWPQWRGPNRDGKIIDAAGWPNDLAALRPIWRVELGPSYSGPILADDRVFVTETIEERDEVVRALSRVTGEEIWVARWPGSIKVPFFARSNGDWIRATPAYDGHSLFVAGIRDVLVCLNADTGAVNWRVDFVERFGSPLPSFGFVSSPLVDGDFVYVQAGASFVKLDKRTGESIWRTLQAAGGMMDSAFSSPVIATLAGVRQILVQTRHELAGVDMESGQVLWRHEVPSFRGMNILTPTVHQDGILTSTHKNATFFYQVGRAGTQWSVTEAWRHKARGYMSSPLIFGHHGFLHLGNGRLCCIDVRTGEEVWRTGSMGDYWSMVGNGDKFLALSEEGELFLVRANHQEFELLDRKRIADQETWGHLAIAGDELYVRELHAISAFSWTAESGRGRNPTGGGSGNQ